MATGMHPSTRPERAHHGEAPSVPRLQQSALALEQSRVLLGARSVQPQRAGSVSSVSIGPGMWSEPDTHRLRNVLRVLATVNRC